MIRVRMALRDSQTNSHPSRIRVAGAVLLACVVSGLLSACVTQTKSPPLAPVKSSDKKAVGAGAATPAKPAPGSMTSVPGRIVGSAVAVDLRPLGNVQTDGYTLPLLSPDGRVLAVQTGTVPDLATLLARPGQSVPQASRIAVYRVDPRGLVRLGETAPGLVLGRAADARGFLVESPRPDGARWIGRIAWGSDEPEWLVQDGRVNAFATLGPNGELAYASREKSDRTFDLVVRRDGRTARLYSEGTRSYVFPCFTADGLKIHAISLRDGILELLEADPASDESLRQSATRALISERADDSTAMQMTTPQGTRDGADGPDWIVFHPMLGSLVRWNAVDGVRAFAGSPIAAGRIDARRTAFLVGNRVRIRSLDDTSGEAEGRMRMDSGVAEPGLGTVLFDSIAVPRAIAPIEGAPALLLVAPDRNGVRLLIARLPA